MRKLAQISGYFPFLVIVDIVCANLGFVFAFLLRFGLELSQGQYNVSAYIENILPLMVAIFFSLLATGLYTSWIHRSFLQLLASVFASSCLIAICAMALSFWGRQFGLPRGVIGVAILLQTVLIACYRALVQYLQKRYKGPKRVLVVGNDIAAINALSSNFRQDRGSWYKVTGCLPIEFIPDLKTWLEDVDVVALTSEVRDRREVLHVCSRFDKEVLILPDMGDVLLHSAQPLAVHDTLMFSVQPTSLTPTQRLFKRVIDVLVSSTMMIIASPVMLILWILIPLNSRGSAIFKQERVGRYGRNFYVYKFRTMISEAERYTGPVLAGKFDPRITRLGRLLRATRLDELPQLFNVFKGDMSLVGPRPERPFFVEQFEHEIPNYGLRLQVKPGITGLAQVKGRYDTTADRKLGFDLLYISNYSLLSDLKILMQTLSVVFRPEQAGGIGVTTIEKPQVLLRDGNETDISVRHHEDPELSATFAND